tara:strand:+ start:84 stop:1040 length:957 start_codon:yes stop_codon:yes gene_type:complete
MEVYSCNLCNFITNRKNNFTRHHKTKKHLKNVENYKKLLPYLSQTSYVPLSQGKIEQKEQEKSRFDHKMTTKYSKMTTNEQHQEKGFSNNQNPIESFLNPYNKVQISQQNNFQDLLIKNSIDNKICPYCLKSFSSKPHTKRHIRYYCKKCIKILENKCDKPIYSSNKINTKKNDNNEQKIHRFNNENRSYITDSLLSKLLLRPMEMVPKLIQYIHFHKKHPENKNLRIRNKKDKLIQIYNGNQWIYRDRNTVIQSVIDREFYLLDDHYNDCALTTMSNIRKNFYQEFRKRFDNNDPILCKKLHQDIYILLLNNPSYDK